MDNKLQVDGMANVFGVELVEDEKGREGFLLWLDFDSKTYKLVIPTEDAVFLSDHLDTILYGDEDEEDEEL